ncbi:MAG: type IX secretion system membrane protein PorP/SprF [Candidatus Delongbacteria bacterium]|nr:type IX secretion system membrane protein PorP/SprF [Candidatus Delongbacteria bacterium]MBN2834637.1 type IX secretion system membrane protein PorP/SprF [Candidatus Delongbacteria bacterium]
MKLVKIALILISVFTLAAGQFGSGLQEGARQEGMGGAFTGLADDGEAVVYNPAGLVNIKHFEAMFSYARHLENIKIENNGRINVGNVGYAHNFGDDIGSFAVKWYYKSMLSDDYESAENMFFVSYGRKIGGLFGFLSDNVREKYLSNLSLGVTLRFMEAGWYDSKDLMTLTGKEDLDSYSWSFGFGLKYDYESFGLGINVKNVNEPNIAQTGTFDDDMDYSAGAYWHYNPSSDKDVIAVEYEKENEGKALKAGTEYHFEFDDIFLKNIALRAGLDYSLDDDNDAIAYSSGLGFEFDYGLKIDYSVKFLTGSFEEDPMNHTISLILTGEMEKNDIYIEDIVSKIESKPEVIEEPVIEPIIEETPEIVVEEIPQPEINKHDYIVVNGDYLIKIAKKENKPLRFWEMIYFYNKDVIDENNKKHKELLKAGNLMSFDLIFPKQEFKIYVDNSFDNQIVEEVTGLSNDKNISDVILLRYERPRIWNVLKSQYDVSKYEYYLYSSDKDIMEGKASDRIVKVDENFKGRAYPGQILLVYEK